MTSEGSTAYEEDVGMLCCQKIDVTLVALVSETVKLESPLHGSTNPTHRTMAV
jgi:hypothetical protein